MNDLFCNQMKAESEFEEHTQHVYQLRTRKDDSGKGFDSLITLLLLLSREVLFFVKQSKTSCLCSQVKRNKNDELRNIEKNL